MIKYLNISSKGQDCCEQCGLEVKLNSVSFPRWQQHKCKLWGEAPHTRTQILYTCCSPSCGWHVSSTIVLPTGRSGLGPGRTAAGQYPLALWWTGTPQPDGPPPSLWKHKMWTKTETPTSLLVWWNSESHFCQCFTLLAFLYRDNSML